MNVPFGCYADGEASLAVRKELAAGPVNTSLVGYTVSYNTLDNNKLPTSGLYAELKQDFAGVGGDVDFIRTSAETRNYYEVFSDIVSVLQAAGRQYQRLGRHSSLRMLDHFQMGPNLVRGFSPAGIGPRDLTTGDHKRCAWWQHVLGRERRGADATVLPAERCRHQARGFRRCRHALGLSRADQLERDRRDASGWPRQRVMIRTSVGVGLLWDSPLGPLRFDLAYPLTKYCATPIG